jgi:SAM-dependent methyltransferase
MFKKFKQRSYELEYIDTGDYTTEEYEGCIVELERVNRWLGDTRALHRSLIATIKKAELAKFSVLDVGAGSGQLLHVLANWTRYHKRQALLVGLELNARSASAISDRSEIYAVRGDAMRLPFADNQFDYAMCSLFTHHFEDAGVVMVFRELNRVARRGIFVIDLFRHPIAYFFYTTLGRLILHNRLLRHDGALSILRSFTPREFQLLGEQAGLQHVSVTRRFPYRLVLSAYKDVEQTSIVEKKAVRRHAAA